jgi:hypothetical protein
MTGNLPAEATRRSLNDAPSNVADVTEASGSDIVM